MGGAGYERLITGELSTNIKCYADIIIYWKQVLRNDNSYEEVPIIH